MPNIQVKNVPPEVHAILRNRAAENHQSLQEFILKTLIEISKLPTDDEFFERHWAAMTAARGDRPATQVSTDKILEIIGEGRADR